MRRFMGGLRYLPMIMQAYADAQTEHQLRHRGTGLTPSPEQEEEANLSLTINAPTRQTVRPPHSKRTTGKQNLPFAALEKRHATGKAGVGSVATDLAWRQILHELRATRQRLRDLEQIKRELQSIQSRLPDLAPQTDTTELSVSTTHKE